MNIKPLLAKNKSVYIEDIVTRSENKNMALFVIPTYEAMVAGVYDNIDDANIELAKKSSPEMFIQAWLNTPQLVAKYDLVMKNIGIDDQEFLLAMTDESMVTNKNLYIFEKDRILMVIKLGDIKNIHQKIGLVSVTTVFELTSGKVASTDKKIPKPIYFGLFTRPSKFKHQLCTPFFAATAPLLRPSRHLFEFRCH